MEEEEEDMKRVSYVDGWDDQMRLLTYRLDKRGVLDTHTLGSIAWK
jgi:hypothetical protein